MCDVTAELGRAGLEVVRGPASHDLELLREPLGAARAWIAGVLHAPGGRRVVDAAWLEGARPGTILVNTARADLVDEAAVARALRAGRLAAFAADTLTGEGAGADSPLLAADLEDVTIITPHSAAQTIEAVDRMGTMAAAEVLAVLAGQSPTHPWTWSPARSGEQRPM